MYRATVKASQPAILPPPLAGWLAGFALCLTVACAQPLSQNDLAVATAPPTTSIEIGSGPDDVHYVDAALKNPGGAPHPFARALSKALLRESDTNSADAHLIRANLQRAAMLPGDGRKHIVVDAGSARLWMFDGDRVEGEMRVIVGKPGKATETPLMVAYIRFALVNPYWNVPPDLVAARIAPAVLREGPGHLTQQRMEALSDWSKTATVLDPAAIDWPAISSGTGKLRVRQLPGQGNMLGRVKFMLPNRRGIYLHDTPEKALFQNTNRWLSSGCVRVEDPVRLWRWLSGDKDLPASSHPEHRVDLPKPMPVYITYLTVSPDAQAAPVLDRYSRDSLTLAAR